MKIKLILIYNHAFLTVAAKHFNRTKFNFLLKTRFEPVKEAQRNMIKKRSKKILL
jgi:hypothetical protein